MVRCRCPSCPGDTLRLSHALICGSSLSANRACQVILNHLLPFLRMGHHPDRCHRRRRNNIRATRRSLLPFLPQQPATIPTSNHSRRDLEVACPYLLCSVLSPRSINKSPTTTREPHRKDCGSHLLLAHPPHLARSCHLPHILLSRVSQSTRTNPDLLLQKDSEIIHRTDSDLHLAL